MPQIIVTTRSGESRTVEARDGYSVMELTRTAGIEEMLAICGGACSCATCHVYVEPAFAHLLAPTTEFEDALLDGSTHRNATSRLSCQVKYTSALEGLRVTIAPED